jgi:hypothetical protein
MNDSMTNLIWSAASIPYTCASRTLKYGSLNHVYTLSESILVVWFALTSLSLVVMLDTSQPPGV